jgi:hypothetical protein
MTGLALPSPRQPRPCAAAATAAAHKQVRGGRPGPLVHGRPPPVTTCGRGSWTSTRLGREQPRTAVVEAETLQGAPYMPAPRAAQRRLAHCAKPPLLGPRASSPAAQTVPAVKVGARRGLGKGLCLTRGSLRRRPGGREAAGSRAGGCRVTRLRLKSLQGSLRMPPVTPAPTRVPLPLLLCRPFLGFPLCILGQQVRRQPICIRAALGPCRSWKVETMRFQNVVGRAVLGSCPFLEPLHR